MGTHPVSETDFNELQFEKKLTTLKDSQECINLCCQWCLTNRQHHKKIVNSWLNVFKRVKVEHRLTLFYLANDVIQYSKRRRYEYVESWGTALQKATTMVRDDRVKHKILRIFKIWEDRGVYNEEFISDLCGLISVTPTAPKNDEPHEFQPTYVISKIRICSNLENDTDMKLKKLKELNPKILEADNFCNSLKDRAHLDDIDKELDTHVKRVEDYINALKAEIKNRITLISVLKQAEGQLDTDRKDVKVVANAYKSFGTRVKTFQKKLDEHMSSLISPIPTPDVNAPSPSSDSDIDLPGESRTPTNTTAGSVIDFTSQPIQFTNANYYNPVPPPSTESAAFVANGFTSFMGTNLPFNVQNFNQNSIFANTIANSSITQTTNSNFGSLSTIIPSLSQPPPLKSENNTEIDNNYPYQTDHSPLLPPPMPPFGTKDDSNYRSRINYDPPYVNPPTTNYGTTQFETPSFQPSEDNYSSYNTSQSETYDPLTSLFSTDASYEPPMGANPYPPNDEYNPEQDMETWEGDASWTQPPLDTDTPESPPAFEKEAYGDPIEYHDNMAQSGASDVDHRILPNLTQTDNTLGRGQDVDHRNLISLIGSPATDSNSNQLPNSDIWSLNDQDYRNPINPNNGDQDYRLPPFDIEQLKLPPPPPPPPKSTPIPVVSSSNHHKKQALTSIKYQDNVESIDMDLSDDEQERKESNLPMQNNLIKVVVGDSLSQSLDALSSVDPAQDLSNEMVTIDRNNLTPDDSPNNDSTDAKLNEPVFSLEPPPPLPDLPDDVEENAFLEDLGNDINDFLSNYSQDEQSQETIDTMWNQQGMCFSPVGHIPPPPMMPGNPNWMPEPPPSFQSPNNFPFRGGGRANNRGNFNNNRGAQNFRDRRGRGGQNNFNNFNNNNNHNNFNQNFNPNFRGGNNFRGRGNGHMRPGRGNGPRHRGNFRGNFRGGF